MSLKKVAALRRRLKPATLRVWHLVPLLGGALLAAVVAVFVVDTLGGSQGAQIVFAVLAFIGVLFLAFGDGKIGAVEGLGVIAALIVLVTALVGGLILVGSIEPEPPLGCVSSDGAIKATVSKENTSIHPKADHASTPTGLLLEGCTIHFDDYCIGTVQTDAQYSGVRDSRWLILSEDEMVASAHTVGSIPLEQDPSTCAGEKPPPDRLTLRGATLSEEGLIELDATAPRAAVVGFALLQENNRWLRLGWDPGPSNDEPVQVVAPPIAQPGDIVFATPCMAFERPIGPTKRISLKAGKVSGDAERFRQPTNRDAAAAACDAGVAEE